MKAKVLIVDDDQLLHNLLTAALSEFEVKSTYSGQEALELYDQQPQSYDIILLDVDMGVLDGYSVCESIRAQSPQIPIIFLSGKTSLEDIIKGYDSGGTDYMTKPFEIAELVAKIKLEVNVYQNEKNLESNLSEVTEAVLSVQNTNAKIYSICRFLQQSFFCKNVDELCERFFDVTKGFGTQATLFIHSPERNTYISSTGKQHLMSEALLNQVYLQGGRIFQFGKDRAVFNWKYASLLVSKLQDDVDNLALLMDGFEMGIKAIEASHKFDRIIKEYTELKYQKELKVANSFEDVVQEIQNELGNIGYNALSEEQENALLRIVEAKRDFVDKLFNQGVKLDEELSRVMQQLRNPGGSKNNGVTEQNSETEVNFF